MSISLSSTSDICVMGDTGLSEMSSDGNFSLHSSAKDIGANLEDGNNISIGTPATDDDEDDDYPWDLVMIFPRKSQKKDDEKHRDRYSVEKFIRLMLGLRNKRGLHRETRETLFQDKLRVVLRTSRCFITHKDESEKSLRDLESLEWQKNYLRNEYIRYCGSDEPTTPGKFSDLIATSVARRLQVACGLTTRIFRTFDDDEILITIRADDMDLRVEADRTDYLLQCSNWPFAPIHEARNNKLTSEIGEETFEESIRHLRNVRGGEDNDEGEMPGMDPYVFKSLGNNDNEKGEDEEETLINRQPKLRKAVKSWGHNPAADGANILNYSSRDSGYRHSTYWAWAKNALAYVSFDRQNYFSPYASYDIEDKFQPYFRWYPLGLHGTKEETLFRQVDRISLISSIIDRHIGVDALIQRKALVDTFALHNDAVLESLRKDWALNFKMHTQPIMRLRNYFGEKVALYFAWLEFYGKMLVLPSIVGLLISIVSFTNSTFRNDDKSRDGYYLIFFSVFVVVWSVLFTELWKRKNAIYNTLWGVRSEDEPTQRPQFLGVVRNDPVTDEPEMWYESVTSRKKKILLGMTVVFVMILIVIIALGGLFYLKHYLTINSEIQYGSEMVSVLNAIQIIILNFVYRFVAIKLNDYENHRTDIEYENFLIIKVFLFQFANSFASFFYIAFLQESVEGKCLNDDCFEQVSSQLMILFIIRIVVGNVMEVVVPTFKYRLRLWNEKASVSNEGGKAQPKYEAAERQAKLNPYEELESFDDYNELVIQYGFVTLFVVAFPLTPLLALINNIVEVHVDAFKLCEGHRRPMPRKTKNIGAWFYFLRLMSSIAILTNSALLLFTSDLFENTSSTTKLLIFILAEHACLGIKFLVERFVNDIPTQLIRFNDRYVHIENQVFKGYHGADEDDHLLSEKAENKTQKDMSGQASTDIDRALLSIRSRADHLRYTIGRLEHNLAWSPTMTWPELLGQFMVISKQLENLNDEIPEMIQHFVCIPKQSTPNPADLPLLLRTREDPEMEEADAELLSRRGKGDDNHTTTTITDGSETWDMLKRKIEQHNDFVDQIEDEYKKESDALLKEMKVNKYSVKAAAKAGSVTSSHIILWKKIHQSNHRGLPQFIVFPCPHAHSRQSTSVGTPTLPIDNDNSCSYVLPISSVTGIDLQLLGLSEPTCYLKSTTLRLTIESNQPITLNVNDEDNAFSSSSMLVSIRLDVDEMSEIQSIVRHILSNGTSVKVGLPVWAPWIPSYSPRRRRTIQSLLLVWTLVSLIWGLSQLYVHFKLFQQLIHALGRTSMFIFKPLWGYFGLLTQPVEYLVRVVIQPIIEPIHVIIVTVSTPIYQVASPLYFLLIKPAVMILQAIVTLLHSLTVYIGGLLSTLSEPFRRLKVPLAMLRNAIVGNETLVVIASRITNAIMTILLWCKAPFKFISTLLAQASTFEFDSQKERLAAIRKTDKEIKLD